jgi:hypothetical protein
VWLTPRSGHFTAENDPVPIAEKTRWAPGPLWKGAEKLLLTEAQPTTVQPVASRYTVWAIPPLGGSGYVIKDGIIPVRLPVATIRVPADIRTRHLPSRIKAGNVARWANSLDVSSFCWNRDRYGKAAKVGQVWICPWGSYLRTLGKGNISTTKLNFVHKSNNLKSCTPI